MNNYLEEVKSAVSTDFGAAARRSILDDDWKNDDYEDDEDCEGDHDPHESEDEGEDIVDDWDHQIYVISQNEFSKADNRLYGNFGRLVKAKQNIPLDIFKFTQRYTKIDEDDQFDFATTFNILIPNYFESLMTLKPFVAVCEITVAGKTQNGDIVLDTT